MKQASNRILRTEMITLAALVFLAFPAHAQSTSEEAVPQAAGSQLSLIRSLQLAPEAADRLQRAMVAGDYIAAEKLLLAEIDYDPHSVRAARLLAYAGSVYFLNRDYINAAVAWKKSEAIAPLDFKLRFSLAMAYVRLSHPDWARKVLESLAAQNEKDALYPYWLGRLDYDGHEYKPAIEYFQQAIALDPQMARAYDNLGLCYYYQNQNQLALANFQKAIELGRNAAHPSPWPYLNIAITQQFMNELADAEKNLREAIRLNPNFPQAHFQLGTVLDDLGRPAAARDELKEAARIAPAYAEPHMALARIDHKLRRDTEAQEEVQVYLRLRPVGKP